MHVKSTTASIHSDLAAIVRPQWLRSGRFQVLTLLRGECVLQLASLGNDIITGEAGKYF